MVTTIPDADELAGPHTHTVLMQPRFTDYKRLVTGAWLSNPTAAIRQKILSRSPRMTGTESRRAQVNKTDADTTHVFFRKDWFQAIGRASGNIASRFVSTFGAELLGLRFVVEVALRLLTQFLVAIDDPLLQRGAADALAVWEIHDLDTLVP
jgi:hypothetical protein